MKKKVINQTELKIKYNDVNCKIKGRVSFKECRECFFSNKRHLSRVLCQKENRLGV